MDTFTSITGGRIITPNKIIQNGSVHWNTTGTITELTDRADIGKNSFDATGLLVCPGFINLHIHGGSGYDTMDASMDALASVARYQVRQGITTFLPTTVSASFEEIRSVVEAVRAFMNAPSPGANVLGLHIEGPYLAAEKSGAQNKSYLRNPSWDEFTQWQHASGGAIRLITLAPERDPEGQFIKRLIQVGVIAAAGHTNASYQTTKKAIKWGLSHGTHVFNAMSRFNYRTPGALEALLEHDQVSLGLIPDCTTVPHVHPVAIRLLKRLAGVERICTITDAVPAAGMPEGEYTLGGLDVIHHDGMVYLKEPWRSRGERVLAGSVLEMNRGIHNLIEQAGFTLSEAIRTATINPANTLKIQDHKGSLERGKHADITLLNPNSFGVEGVFVRGQLRYRRDRTEITL